MKKYIIGCLVLFSMASCIKCKFIVEPSVEENQKELHNSSDPNVEFLDGNESH